MTRSKYLLFLYFNVCCIPIALTQDTIPGASKQPAWVFPLYFQEGTGQRDTLFLGYAEDASYFYVVDTKYGEIETPIDTTKFNVKWGGSWYCAPNKLCDSALKVNVGDASGGAGCPNCIIGGTFSFLNGFLPLKIWWNPNLFYSDSLPQPNQFPAPKVQGKLSWDLPMWLGPGCSFQYPLLMTDSITGFDCYIELIAWSLNILII